MLAAGMWRRALVRVTMRRGMATAARGAPARAVDTIQVGDTASLTRVFTQDDVDAFAQLSGDMNPIHVDAAFAATTRFKKPIAHGMLAGSLFSTIFGTQFPGTGAIYLGQSLRFTAPCYPGEPLTARVTVVDVRPDKPIITLETVAHREADGVQILKGTATLMVPRG